MITPRYLMTAYHVPYNIPEQKDADGDGSPFKSKLSAFGAVCNFRPKGKPNENDVLPFYLKDIVYPQVSWR